MPSEQMWCWDAGPWLDICFRHGVTRFVFRAKIQHAPSIRQDFRRVVNAHARGRQWEVIWIPYPGDFAVKFDHEGGFDQHTACWPIWRCTDHSIDDLRHLIDEPQRRGSMGEFIPVRGRDGKVVGPVEGQEHRVIVTNWPQSVVQWLPIVHEVLELQSLYRKDVILHTHGQMSIDRTIGMGFKSFDDPVRRSVRDGIRGLLLPSGAVVKCDYFSPNGRRILEESKSWLNLIGVTPSFFKHANRDLLGRAVYEANLRSLKWAFMNYDKAWDIRRTASGNPNIPDDDWEPPEATIRFRRHKNETPFDRWTCDTCSLNRKCPYARKGSVCIVPDSDAAELVEMFGTRSSARIIDALGKLLEIQSKRAQKGLDLEDLTDSEGNPVGLQPEVTRILNTTFDRGVQLAKLLDPTLAARMTPRMMNVAMLNVAQGTLPATSQSLASGVAGVLEAKGIAIEDATPEIVAEVLKEQGQLIDVDSQDGADADTNYF